MKRGKIKSFFVTAAQFIFNPHFLICFGLAWLITNGWSYIMLGIGTYLKIGWMIAVSSAYLAFLWLPISPEKIVTLAISMWLLKIFFPNDKKTLGILKRLHSKIVTPKKQKSIDNSTNESDKNTNEKGDNNEI